MTILTTLTHLVDKRFVERANTVLMLGVLWGALAVSSSVRCPMTLPIGSKPGDQRRPFCARRALRF